MLSVRPLLFAIVASLLILSTAQAQEPAAARVEDFGVTAFRRDFYGTLDVMPFACDNTVPGGAGHSRITFTGEGEPFAADWVERGVEFVGFRIHKNDLQVTREAYFPAVLGSRYARVVRVIDGRTLVVDFEYNGGSTEASRVSKRASGYFFIDCAPALRKMVQAPDRPERFVFQSGQTYVCKGMPGIPFLAAEQSRDLRWSSSDPAAHAAVKISAEDAAPFVSRKETSTLPAGPFFRLDAHDHSIYLDGIDILGPTYTVPVVQESWDGVMFAFLNGQCARTLEIRNCNTFAEKQAVAALGVTLPDGANWVAPDITGIVAGGGRRGDRGDGVIDMLAYQRFNLIRSTWVCKCVHSIKNNDGAGNWITIDGEELDADGRPVHMVYEAMYAKRNQFPDVRLSFHDFEGEGKRRGVRIESDDFSWPMLANQYWTGGTSTGGGEPVEVEVDGFSLYFGNNGDWRRESGNVGAYSGMLNARDAMLFDRIPKHGDRVPAERVEGGAWAVWGWGLQDGDVLESNGRPFKVADRKRKATGRPLLDHSKGGYAHYWEITLQGDGLPAGDRAEFTVAKSRTEYLLAGRTRVAKLVYRRDLHGHWQYNRAEINYQYRNICFNGNYRETSGPAKNTGDYQGLWEAPMMKEWVNCWAMATDGSMRGKPAAGIRSEAFNKRVLQFRNTHPDSRRRDYHILVDGGHLFAQRASQKIDPVWLCNRPQLINGSASFGEPRFCNPVLMDTKGLDASMTDLSFSLVGGFTLDLSNTVVGSAEFKQPANLRLYGNGTVILDNVRFAQVRWNKQPTSGGVRTDLANGLQRDAFRLFIRGTNGVGGFRLEGKPEDGSIVLTDWTLRRMPFCKQGLQVFDGWKALAGKITVNGAPVAD